ncbi:MAG: deoxyribodipyrimidine photo-lyase [Planctomycetota bacterium]
MASGKGSERSRALVWFRSDLRVSDNTALDAACRQFQEVVAVFTICPDQWLEHDWASCRVTFLLQTLGELSSALEKLSIPLLIRTVPRFDGIAKELASVAKTHDCDALYFNREYEVNELRRDTAVVEEFEARGLRVRGYTDQVVIAPESINTSQGKFYTVFTPYKKSWVRALRAMGDIECRKTPRARRDLSLESDRVPSTVKGFAKRDLSKVWPAGEKEARRRLKKFVARRILDYAGSRDFPGVEGTSSLSPYLAVGSLSPRQCLKAALDANNGSCDEGRLGVTTWISELIWREFYRHVLVGYPRVCRNHPFDLRTRDIEWREDDAGFERWCLGETGVPIVDAAMRQLAEIGWMHNRLRMVVAMFLTKNLFIDWRRGEKFFMNSLIDGDFASNNGGWQWSASVGTDAAPYFRVFNPMSQSEKFDPDGAFIRRYVPEISQRAGKDIHKPGPLEVFESYPPALVDLKESRKRAIDLFRDTVYK